MRPGIGARREENNRSILTKILLVFIGCTKTISETQLKKKSNFGASFQTPLKFDFLLKIADYCYNNYYYFGEKNATLTSFSPTFKV